MSRFIPSVIKTCGSLQNHIYTILFMVFYNTILLDLQSKDNQNELSELYQYNFIVENILYAEFIHKQ